MTHGSGHHRKPGSIGASTHIGRVLKGKKMPGKDGNKYRTMINSFQMVNRPDWLCFSVYSTRSPR